MAIKVRGKVLSAREQARAVREWTGWTREQYQKQYDILRNRTRAFERATGRKKGSINVADILARDARSRYFARFYGEQYRPTNLYTAIQAAPASSTGRTLSTATAARVEAAAVEATRRQFRGFLEKSKYAAAAERMAERLRKAGTFTAAKYERILSTYGDISTTAREAGEASNLQRDPWERRQPES